MEYLRTDDPRRLGDFQLLRRLGAGGMGVVYLARSSRGRHAALKVVRGELATELDFRARFTREVQATRRASGATAEVLDADTEGELPWVATEYVPGPSLQDVVAEHGQLPVRTVWHLAHDLSVALADVHRAGLVHRDLKPSNVLVTLEGPRVIDFGIARAAEGSTGLGATMTRTGMVVGSPGFMSPEQCRGEDVSGASDVFTLGSVIGFASTGQSPFGPVGTSPHTLMLRIIQGEADLSGVPTELAAVVQSCLHPDPIQRPTPEQLVRTISAWVDDQAWLPPTLLAQVGQQATDLLAAESPEHPSAEPAGPYSPGSPPPGPEGFGPPVSLTAVGAAELDAEQPRGRRKTLWVTATAGTVCAGIVAAVLFLPNSPIRGDSGEQEAASESEENGGGEYGQEETPEGIADAEGDTIDVAELTVNEDGLVLEPHAYIGSWQGFEDGEDDGTGTVKAVRIEIENMEDLAGRGRMLLAVAQENGHVLCEISFDSTPMITEDFRYAHTRLDQAWPAENEQYCLAGPWDHILALLLNDVDELVLIWDANNVVSERSHSTGLFSAPDRDNVTMPMRGGAWELDPEEVGVLGIPDDHHGDAADPYEIYFMSEARPGDTAMTIEAPSSSSSDCVWNATLGQVENHTDDVLLGPLTSAGDGCEVETFQLLIMTSGDDGDWESIEGSILGSNHESFQLTSR